MQEPHPSTLISLIPLLIVSVVFCFVGHYLAKDKGRPVKLWTVLSLIPLVNFYCMIFLVGCTNLRIERKLDEILNALPSKNDTL